VRSPAADLSAVGTPAPSAASESLTPAYNESAAALQNLADSLGEPLDIIVPQFLTGSSTVDVLRLAAAASIPSAAVPDRLKQLGWSTLVIQQALAGTGAGSREWVVRIYHFLSAEGAAGYAQSPFLLPPALLGAQKQPLPAGTGPDAPLRRAPDTITPLLNPGAQFKGERAAVVWNSGQVVFEVMQSSASPDADLLPLFRLVADLNNRAVRIPNAH
jgi:hypothetical protein